MNLNDIIQAAQGGQGVANLATQFGLTPDQAQAAVQALTPAFSTALQKARECAKEDFAANRSAKSNA